MTLLSLSASSRDDVSESTGIRNCPTLLDLAFLERGVISGLLGECDVVVCECVDVVIPATEWWVFGLEIHKYSTFFTCQVLLSDMKYLEFQFKLYERYGDSVEQMDAKWILASGRRGKDSLYCLDIWSSFELFNSLVGQLLLKALKGLAWLTLSKKKIYLSNYCSSGVVVRRASSAALEGRCEAIDEVAVVKLCDFRCLTSAAFSLPPFSMLDARLRLRLTNTFFTDSMNEPWWDSGGLVGENGPPPTNSVLSCFNSVYRASSSADRVRF